MPSRALGTTSTALLATGGVALLFAADALLPALVVAFPREGAWIGQLLGAAWLSLAWITWLTRGTVQGGIYGRPVVLANTTLYFVSAMVLIRAALPGGAAALWIIAIIASAMALAYAMLMFGRSPEAIATGRKQA